MTYRCYPDILRTSPAGRLRLEICSPDNAGSSSQLRVDQNKFAYTVRDAETREFIWQHYPGIQRPLDQPEDAWVNDDGFVVVVTKCTASSTIVLIAPSGRVMLELCVTPQLLGGNSDEMCKTSAGPAWNSHGTGMFLSVDSKTYWCFRTQFGRQIVINLDNARVDYVQSIRDELHWFQVQNDVELLKRASTDTRLFPADARSTTGRFKNQDYEFASSVWTAAYWCGKNCIHEAANYLKGIEQSPLQDSSSAGWPTPSSAETWCTSLTLTRVAQMALRCLDIEPTGIAGYQLWRRDWSDDEGPLFLQRIDVPECLTNRPARLSKLREGMSRDEVSQIVGMPDVEWGLWDYDVLNDSGQSYTVRLAFDRMTIFPAKLTDIVTFAPVWKTVSERDRDL